MLKIFLSILFALVFLGLTPVNSYAYQNIQNFCGEYCGISGSDTCKQFYIGGGYFGSAGIYASYCVPINDTRILAYNQQCPAGQVIDKCDTMDSFHAQCSNTYPAQLCTCKPAPPPPVCNGECTTNSQCPLECPVCTPTGEVGGSTCQAAPTATPTTTPSQTPTPTDPPTFCNETCEDASDCALATDTCTACLPDPEDETRKTCQTEPTATPTPSASPTPTVPVACNADCSSDSDICKQATDGCTYCSPTTDTCVRPECGTPCEVPADCEGALTCSVCADDPDSPTGKSCQALPTPTLSPTAVPTATLTPTPDPFDESMCKCDGIEYTQLLSGQNVTVTAFGKVEGSDTSYAQIPHMDFTFMRSSGNSPLAERVGPQRVATTIESQTAGKVRYKAVWNFTVPADVNSSETYRLQAQLRCSKKSASIPMSSVVLAESTENRGFFGGLSDFFWGLFGIRRPDVVATNETTTTSSQKTDNKNLKLRTFTPGIPEDTDNCSFVRFRFGQSETSGY